MSEFDPKRFSELHKRLLNNEVLTEEETADYIKGIQNGETLDSDNETSIKGEDENDIRPVKYIHTPILNPDFPEDFFSQTSEEDDDDIRPATFLTSGKTTK